MRPRVFTPPAPDPRTAAALDAIAPPRYPVRSPVEGEELSADVRARARALATTPPKTSAPAPDPGRVLLATPRHDGTELRVSLHAYEGRPFVRVAPWQRSGDGSWWPVKGRGVTVKVRELGAVAAALVDAHDAANDGGAK